jgi:UDP-N-acetylmuramate dehydrogenase
VKEFKGIDAKNLTSMHCGGKIERLIEADSNEELFDLISGLDKFFILGAGCNTIFEDGSISMPLLRLGSSFDFIERQGNTIYAGAATPLPRILDFCIKEGLTGLEFMAGIPGKLGGALCMNAGTKDEWIMSRVDFIEIADSKGIHKVKAKDLNCRYRSGNIPSKSVVIGAFLLLDAGNTSVVKERIEKALEKRKNQPKGYSSGSIFKNPEGANAGQLIDKAGLKGFKVGGAVISDVHANFIINQGSATTSDIKTLIKIIKERVKTMCGVDLEEEVKIIG